MAKFYVAKNGSDLNCGTKEKPFETVEKAQSEVRKLIEKGLEEPVSVVVGAGEYKTDGLVFTEKDSGTADCPVIYEADGEVILNGGIMLNACDFEALDGAEKERLYGDAKENVVKVDLKKYGLTRSDWGEISAVGSHGTAHKYDDAVISPMSCELFFNDERMNVARYPNEGYIHTEEPVREGVCLEPTGQICRKAEEWEAIRNPLGDIRKIDAETNERVKKWKTQENVWEFGYPKYGWADESSPVVSINTETREMETKYVSIFGIKEHAPYYFFNVFEELDVPGEWFLDRENGILYLYPTSDLETAKIILSITSKNLIKMEKVDHLTVKGFTFMGTRTDAIDVVGNNITIDGCEIKNVSGWAAKISGMNCCVKNCSIHHTGEGGVKITGGDRATLTPSGNVVTNNHIYSIAKIYQTYRPGVDIDGVSCVVSHNCIHDSAHQAMMFHGNDHIIEYNEMYDVCQVADDSSAIYSGRDYTVCGNVIRYNYFHDMKSDADNHIGIFGMYCDDNLGACTTFGNVFYRCQSALLLHGGHDQVFKNNLIIDGCPKSVYSVRFHAYGYWPTLVKGGCNNQVDHHWRCLDKVPWESDLWRERYPHIAEYLTWDPEHEQRFPHYCEISNNIIINHKPIDINFEAFESRNRNIIKNNVEYSERSFVGIPDGDKLDISNNRFKEIIPDFEDIPFEKMGLLK
ncbi:MAG: right-handed parallel beta-helix repeat-containing protein [Clostridia bacterium]|nr:right-handed parallel beta-helix repeat-containing protein [Clostridia bacterium]